VVVNEVTIDTKPQRMWIQAFLSSAERGVHVLPDRANAAKRFAPTSADGVAAVVQPYASR